MAGAKKLGLFLCLVLCLSMVLDGRILALSAEQRRVFDSGVYHFDVEAGGTENCATILPGSNNEEIVWNYLVTPSGSDSTGGMGFTAVQAAGIMGNLRGENTTFDPTVTNSIGAHGIAQWYQGRRTGLQNYATSKGTDENDLTTQLEYLKIELEGPYKSAVLDPIRASNDLEQITRIWLEDFEVPCLPGRDGTGCDEEMTRRLPFAQDYLTRLGSTSAPSSGGVVSTCGGNGQVGGYSLPVDRAWYDAHAGEFDDPHHDYPAIDLPTPTGTEIFSVSSGTIISITSASGKCGIGMVIDAGNGVQFNYCHSSDAGTLPGAAQGDTVSAGHLIMHSDDTGNSTGPHLHLGVEINGENRCPQSLLIGIANGSPPDIMSLPNSGCVNGHVGDVRRG